VDGLGPEATERASQAVLQKVAHEGMRSDDVAQATAPSKKAVSLALLNEAGGVLDRNVCRDGPQFEVDRFEHGCAHEELLEVVWELADDFLGEVFVEMAFGAAQ
jgi:hypothetical protein